MIELLISIVLLNICLSTSLYLFRLNQNMFHSQVTLLDQLRETKNHILTVFYKGGPTPSPVLVTSQRVSISLILHTYHLDSQKKIHMITYE